jgi:hypothetical protein
MGAIINIIPAQVKDVEVISVFVNRYRLLWQRNIIGKFGKPVSLSARQLVWRTRSTSMYLLQI